MMKRFLLLLSISGPAFSAATLPAIPLPNGQVVISTPVVQVDQSGNPVSSSVPTGPAGTPNTNVVTVQGITGATPLNISASTLPLPAGGSTSANQATEIAALGLLHSDLTAPLPAFAATPTFNIGTAPTLTVTGTVAATQSGSWNVNATQGAAGFTQITNGTTNAGIDATTTGLKVYFAGGGYTVPITASAGNFVDIGTGSTPTATTVNGRLLALTPAQGATTAGVIGPLTQCAATTAAPTYATATINPCSLTTAGGMRHDISSYNGTALTGTVTAYGTAPTGNVFGVNAAVTSGTITTVTTVGSVTADTLAAAAPTTDIASAAITTTTTSAAIATTNMQAYSFTYNVTAVSGTTPTDDAKIQECADAAGTINCTDIYHFARVTAATVETTPLIRSNGGALKYVETIAGTTPSFTRSLTRRVTQITAPAERRFFDRAIVLTTLSSTTAAFNVESASQLTVNVSETAGTVAASVQLQVSDDNSNWVSVGTATALGTGAVNTNIYNGAIATKWARLIVTTAGTGTTYNYIVFHAR